MWSLAGVQRSEAKGDEKNGAVLSDCPSQPLCVHWASGWTMPEHIKALPKHCLPALTFGLLLCGRLHVEVCVCVCVRAGWETQWAEVKERPAVLPTPCSTIMFNKFPLSIPAFYWSSAQFYCMCGAWNDPSPHLHIQLPGLKVFKAIHPLLPCSLEKVKVVLSVSSLQMLIFRESLS